ncbi:unnamed protein product [Brassica oleracea]
MAKSRRVGWDRHKCVPFNLKDKARREVRDRTDVGSSAPSSFAAEVKGAKKKTVPNKCGR